MCGKLFCAGGMEMPRDGSLVTFGSCKASFPRNEAVDPGMILEGTKCGPGMVSRAKLFSLVCSFFGLSGIISSSTTQHFKQGRLNWTLNYCSSNLLYLLPYIYHKSLESKQELLSFQFPYV